MLEKYWLICAQSAIMEKPIEGTLTWNLVCRCLGVHNHHRTCHKRIRIYINEKEKTISDLVFWSFKNYLIECRWADPLKINTAQLVRSLERLFIYIIEA